MTAIVAIQTRTNVVMGGDSATHDGYVAMVRRDPKVFRAGRFVIGFTTSFRMGQLLRFGTDEDGQMIADLRPTGNPLEFMVAQFIPQARKIFNHAGYAKIEHHRETGGTFLVAWRRHLFCVHSDYQVAATGPLAVCGCGREFALGALYATPKNMKPANRIRIALRAAAQYSPGVGPPYKILETGR